MPAWNVRFDLTVDLSNPELLRLVERAHALSAVIREIPIPPHLQVKLDTINIVRAVRGTTAIEGAQVSPDEVRRIIESPHMTTLPEARRRDEQEVRNAQEVMFYVANLLRAKPDHPVTQELICTLHELTTKGIDYQHNTPGIYRTHAVSAGDYLPPAHGDDVKRLMSEFMDWFRSPPAVNWDPIVRALAAHFYVISVHPFGDGNGRTARAVESFLLYQGHVNARGFYSVANYYYEHRTDYIWHLDNARFNSANDLTSFILFGLQGLVEELHAVHAEVLSEVKLMSFRDYARDIFLQNGRLGTKAGIRMFYLLIALGRDPLPIADIKLKATSVSSLYRKVSLRTLQRDIALLRDEELVRIEDGAVVPNLEIMEKFTALQEIQEIQKYRQAESRKAEAGDGQRRT
ncbi:MAG: Fic family protein [Dehalococcoidia bacterium]